MHREYSMINYRLLTKLIIQPGHSMQHPSKSLFMQVIGLEHCLLLEKLGLIKTRY